MKLEAIANTLKKTLMTKLIHYIPIIYMRTMKNT